MIKITEATPIEIAVLATIDKLRNTEYATNVVEMYAIAYEVVDAIKFHVIHGEFNNLKCEVDNQLPPVHELYKIIEDPGAPDDCSFYPWELHMRFKHPNETDPTIHISLYLVYTTKDEERDIESPTHISITIDKDCHLDVDGTISFSAEQIADCGIVDAKVLEIVQKLEKITDGMNNIVDYKEHLYE